MRVLFMQADGISAPVRIRPLLEQLRSSGHIAGFACVDRDLAMDGSERAFDVVLVHRNPGARQFAWLKRSGLPFVYDIDDLLLREPTARLGRRQAREREAIHWCLAHAQAVTSPSHRLLASLENRLGQSLGGRAVFLPNAGFAPAARASPMAGPPRLLWVSTHGRHSDALCAIANGIAAAARDIGTGVILVGHFPDSLRVAIPGHVHVPWLEPTHYQRFLAEGPLIAAVPLVTDLVPDDPEFVDCKSDIKAAQFCSLGIAGLYSPSPPYTESDLPCSIAATDTAADWRRELVERAERFPREGTMLAQHPALAARRPDVIARGLFDVLSQARAAAPFAFRATPTPKVLRRLERGLRAIRTRLFR